ncbi:MAG: DUF2760 domain-containing protein [Pirellulaceae bacterium]
MRLGLAFKAFFQILMNRQAADAYRRLIDTATKSGSVPDAAVVADASTTTSKSEASATTKSAARRDAVPAKPLRNDAITLLATLQRESRLIDLLQESLDDYSDQQVGAAARDVIRDARKSMERMFAIVPLTEQVEGDSMQTEGEVDPGRIRLIGNVQGNGPFCGAITHHGWEASKCELPSWSGRAESSRVIAPIELEVD